MGIVGRLAGSRERVDAESLRSPTAEKGTPFTDEDIELRASGDESEEGYTAGRLRSSRSDRPASVAPSAGPGSGATARERHITTSQSMHELIDNL